MSESEQPQRRVAASTALLREGDEGLEVLVARRNDSGSYAGAWVFPGGMVDPEDEVESEPQLTLRRTACREFTEECGTVLTPANLEPWSRWISPPGAPKAVDNWVFVTSESEGLPKADGQELMEVAWVKPDAALRLHGASEMVLYPPTWVTLYHFSALGSLEHVLAVARGRSPLTFASHVLSASGSTVMVWPESPHESPDPDHQLDISTLPWRYTVTSGVLGTASA